MSSQTQLPGGSPFSSQPARASAPSATRPHLVALPAAGPEVDARGQVEPGTSVALASVLVIVFLALALVAVGWFAAATNNPRGQAGAGNVFAPLLTGLLFALVFWIHSIFTLRRARAILHASALRVGPRQFPEIHACANEYARRLGLDEAPDVYVLDAGSVNGFTFNFKKRSMIVLTDETVAACLEGRSPGALGFVLAHELAHVALGHTRWWRQPLRTYRKLSRLDECSADNVACELVGSREAAQDGVLLLTAGPRLLSFVDRAAALEQAAEVANDPKTARLERNLTHPLTLLRLDRIARRFGTVRDERRLAA